MEGSPDFDLTYMDGCTIVDYKLNPFTLEEDEDITGSSKITLITDNDKRIVIKPKAGCCAIPWLSVKGNDLDKIKGNKFKNIVFDERDLDIQELNDESDDGWGRSKYVTSHKITISFHDTKDFTFYIHISHNGYYDGWINVEVKDLN